MSRKCPTRKSKSCDSEKIKYLQVKHLKAKEATICKLNFKDGNGGGDGTLNIDALNAETVRTNNLFVKGANVECLIGRAPIRNTQVKYDCMDCEGNPIKPDVIDQDVWDFLACNREAYRLQLQQQFLDGREQIRCIRQAYGCEPQCPSDCPVPSSCQATFMGSIEGTTLTVTSIEAGSGLIQVGFELGSDVVFVEAVTLIVSQLTGTPGGVGTYQVSISQTVTESLLWASVACPTPENGCAAVPAECIPDPNTCPLEVENLLYRTLTVPFYTNVPNPCGGVNEEGFPFATSRLLTVMGYNLDINNVTCNLAPRVCTVLLHYAYKGSNTPTPPPLDPCEPCPGQLEPEDLQCLCLDPPAAEIQCGIIRVNCRQFEATINILLGENYSANIQIPLDVIEAMIAATPLPADPNNVIGAFQLAIFIEDGIAVTNNMGTRGGGGGSASGDANVQGMTCFNPEAEILMADGSIKQAKDVAVGDLVANGYDTTKTSKIMARTIQAESTKEVVKIGELLISRPHRVMWEGKWMKPEFVPGAEIVDVNTSLYNFVTEDMTPIVVNGIIASTLGMYCEGSHDMTKPLHQVWASPKIIELLQTHPTWPNVKLASNDPFIHFLKSVRHSSTEFIEKNYREEILC